MLELRRTFVDLPKQAILGFIDHDCPAHAAALAYYTVFSLPPLLLVMVAISALVFDRRTIVSTIYIQVNQTLGANAAQQVVDALFAAQNSTSSGSLQALLGLTVLGFSATGAFSQLQSSLNRIWEVKPDPSLSEVRSFLLKRISSFGMVVSLGFLLMVSLLLSAALAALSSLLNQVFPMGISAPVLWVLTGGGSWLIFGALFCGIYKVLPDAALEWRDVIVGGLITSLLFMMGRSLIGLYLANSKLTNAYGAAASLVLILAWTYYASMVVLLGAEITRAWTASKGRTPEPESGAVRVKQQEIRVG